MFGRRNKRSALSLMRETLWPSMGWRRMGRYIALRMIRLNATPHQIALGFAFGAGVSFVPLPGLHIISAAILSKISRVSIIASVIGTVVGNPWTFPFMWWGAYYIGGIMFNIFGLPVETMPDNFTWGEFVNTIKNNPVTLLMPWVMGGILLMLLSLPIFYYIVYRLVTKARKRIKTIK